MGYGHHEMCLNQNYNCSQFPLCILAHPFLNLGNLRQRCQPVYRKVYRYYSSPHQLSQVRVSLSQKEILGKGNVPLPTKVPKNLHLSLYVGFLCALKDQKLNQSPQMWVLANWIVIRSGLLQMTGMHKDFFLFINRY